MQALNKTKATMQGRQCRLTFVQLSNQDITAISPVNSVCLELQICNSGAQTPDMALAHFFSSRCASSLRIMRFIQAETVASPSWATAFLISFSRSSSTLSAICLLPLPFIEMVDTWLTPFYSLICLKCMTGVNQKATPCSARNTYRASHQNVIEAYIMAEQQHTQTRPKYQYRFMALDRADMAAKPCRLSVEAETEQDARRILAPHFILSLAARLPVVEVSHA